ncbi:hypothetical protein B0H15DRAFT_814318 [Mycena belliarum]|uniref:Uncharacterized protein n=1 Tax=Mycena belliarum TaxID=1033014 RepID=A0AAD6XTM3_9AGAR|nr:hypothetical protein B0H15DRAFT_814318 [Mycena belliae]
MLAEWPPKKLNVHTMYNTQRKKKCRSLVPLHFCKKDGTRRAASGFRSPFVRREIRLASRLTPSSLLLFRIIIGTNTTQIFPLVVCENLSNGMGSIRIQVATIPLIVLENICFGITAPPDFRRWASRAPFPLIGREELVPIAATAGENVDSFRLGWARIGFCLGLRIGKGDRRRSHESNHEEDEQFEYEGHDYPCARSRP